MFNLILIPICAILNRGRGSQFWNLVPSTIVSRLVMAALVALTMTALTANIWLFPSTLAGLMLWCTPAWDKYWSAQIGNDLPLKSKSWGNSHMFLRQLLILPTFAGTAFLTDHIENFFWAFPALIYWLPYYVFGFGTKSLAIMRAEYTIGALMGLSFYLIIG